MSLKELETNAPDVLEIDKIPASVDVVVKTKGFEKDKNGRKCLYAEFTILEGKEKNKTFTIKYTPYHFNALIDAFNALKIDGFVEGTKLRMERTKFNMGFDRHIPIKVL